MNDQPHPKPTLPPAPKAAIDAGSRTVLFEQAHPLLVGQDQKVLTSFAFLKAIVAKIIDMEAQAERATGDPTAIPSRRPPGANGTQP